MKYLQLLLVYSLFSINVMPKESFNSVKFDLVQNQTNDSIKFFRYNDLFHKHIYKSPDVSKSYLDSIVLISTKNTTFLYKGITEFNTGLYFKRINDNKKAKEYLEHSIDIFTKIDDKSRLITAYEKLSGIHRNLGQLDAAMENQMSAIQIKKGLGYADHLFSINYVSLGSIHGRARNFDESTKYFLEAEQIFLKHNKIKSLTTVYNNLGLNHKYTGETDAAIEYYQKAISLNTELNDQYKLALNYSNIGNIFAQRAEFNKAKYYYKKSLSAAKISKNTSAESRVINNLGKVSLESKDYQSAITYLQKAYEMSRTSGRLKGELRNVNNLSTAYLGLGNYKKAYEYSQTARLLTDSIWNKESGERIATLEVKYETEKKENALKLQEEEIKSLNATAENDKLIKIIYGGGAVAGIVLSGLLFFGFRQRMKKNKIEREKKEEMYKQEILFKQKELTSQTLHLVQKNTFLRELKENLESLKNSPEKFKIEFKRIVMLLKKESATDKDWEVFKSYFSKVHNGFDTKLKNISDAITEKDLRLASFIKMNLSTKEIAAILNVLPESVLTSKYRLKKKLEIDKETDIYNFLMNI
jgi:tetratricopeptide (TPR) repeat protein/DNA-binding CsgD family transcriptional regulator